MAITGIPRVAGSARNRPSASIPSIPGSRMSIRTRLGRTRLPLDRLVGWEPDEKVLRVSEVLDEDLCELGGRPLTSRDPVGGAGGPRAACKPDQPPDEGYSCS